MSVLGGDSNLDRAPRSHVLPGEEELREAKMKAPEERESPRWAMTAATVIACIMILALCAALCWLGWNLLAPETFWQRITTAAVVVIPPCVVFATILTGASKGK